MYDIYTSLNSCANGIKCDGKKLPCLMPGDRTVASLQPYRGAGEQEGDAKRGLSTRFEPDTNNPQTARPVIFKNRKWK